MQDQDHLLHFMHPLLAPTLQSVKTLYIVQALPAGFPSTPHRYPYYAFSSKNTTTAHGCNAVPTALKPLQCQAHFLHFTTMPLAATFEAFYSPTCQAAVLLLAGVRRD